MSKTIKQPVPKRGQYKKATNVSGKFIGTTPVSPRVKEVLSKPHEDSPTNSIVVHLNQELGNTRELKKTIAKVEEAKALFANFRATK